MCRACSGDSPQTDLFLMEIVPAYHEAKNAVEKYEEALLRAGNADKAHKGLVKISKQFNKHFSEWEFDKEAK